MQRKPIIHFCSDFWCGGYESGYQMVNVMRPTGTTLKPVTLGANCTWLARKSPGNPMQLTQGYLELPQLVEKWFGASSH